MTRRKGEVTARMHEREAPHLVEMALPNGAFGLILIEAIHTFHRERGIAIRRGRRQRRGEQEYVRFCFADAATADAFQARFGGKRGSVGNRRG